MSWKAFIAAFGCCLVAVAAVAQLLSPTFPRLGGSCSSGYSGVLDIVPGATACYSFRACDKALACGAAPAIVITQPDGTTPHTIHVTSSGILNQTELAPLVATVDTVFDQTKNVLGLDIKTQTGSTRPN